MLISVNLILSPIFPLEKARFFASLASFFTKICHFLLFLFKNRQRNTALFACSGLFS